VALFVVGAMQGRRQLVVVPRFVAPGVVGDVGPLGMACRGCGLCRACPLPSSVKSLTPDSSFYVRSSKGSVGLCGACALARG
jgi:hypothetical protein